MAEFQYVMVDNLTNMEPEKLEQLALDVMSEANEVRKAVLAELQRQEDELRAAEELRAEKRRSIAGQLAGETTAGAKRGRKAMTKEEKEAAKAAREAAKAAELDDDQLSNGHTDLTDDDLQQADA